jgi:hypothetical protein
MNVVADTNLVGSAIFWRDDSPGCFVLWARPRFHLAISVPIVEEDANNTSRRLSRCVRVWPCSGSHRTQPLGQLKL